MVAPRIVEQLQTCFGKLCRRIGGQHRTHFGTCERHQIVAGEFGQMRTGCQNQLLRLIGLPGNMEEILPVKGSGMDENGNGKFQRGMQRQPYEGLFGRINRFGPALGLVQKRIMVATGQQPDKHIIENSQLVLIGLQREILIEIGQTLEQAAAFCRIAGSHHRVDIAQEVSCLGHVSAF